MGVFKRPKIVTQEAPPPPKATEQEKALSLRVERSRDKEIEEENRRKKALVRNTLGTQSLLKGLAAAPVSGVPGAKFTGTSFAGGTGGRTGSPTQTLLTGATPSAPTGGGGRQSQFNNFTSRGF